MSDVHTEPGSGIPTRWARTTQRTTTTDGRTSFARSRSRVCGTCLTTPSRGVLSRAVGWTTTRRGSSRRRRRRGRRRRTRRRRRGRKRGGGGRYGSSRWRSRSRGVGRGDGEVLRRVRAAQEAAQERGEVSLVCDIKFSMTRIHLLDHIGIHVPYQIEYFATVDFCIGTGPLGGPHPCPRSSSYR